MKLKRISDEEIGCAYLKYDTRPEGRAIAQAQLEADQETHEAIARETIRELEEHIALANDWTTHIVFSSNDWQAFKKTILRRISYGTNHSGIGTSKVY